MAPLNVFSFLEERRRGGARRNRMLEPQMKMLRLEERWSFEDASALPWAEGSVKDVVPLDLDAFCVVSKLGHADAYLVDDASIANHTTNGGNPGVSHSGDGGANARMAVAGTDNATVGSLRWLADLRLFGDERVRLVTHIRCSQVLMVVFNIAHEDRSERRSRRHRGTLYLRLLDVSAIKRGETLPLDYGTLTAAAVPEGGFVEMEEQNKCIFIYDIDTLRCWDARSFEQRFVLGPWEDAAPSIRFTCGFVAAVLATDHNQLDLRLHSVADGRLVGNRVLPIPDGAAVHFVEIVNELALVKTEGSDVHVLNLLDSSSPPVVVRDSSAWDPELFVFVPSQYSFLANIKGDLELWKITPGVGVCRRIATIPDLGRLEAGRFVVDEQLMTIFIARPAKARSDTLLSRHGKGDDLLLLDLAKNGCLSAALQGACEGHGGGGVASMSLDLTKGSLVLLSRRGALAAFSTAA